MTVWESRASQLHGSLSTTRSNDKDLSQGLFEPKPQCAHNTFHDEGRPLGLLDKMEREPQDEALHQVGISWWLLEGPPGKEVAAGDPGGRYCNTYTPSTPFQLPVTFSPHASSCIHARVIHTAYGTLRSLLLYPSSHHMPHAIKISHVTVL